MKKPAKTKRKILDQGYGLREISRGIDDKGYYIQIRLYFDPTDESMKGASKKLSKELAGAK